MSKSYFLLFNLHSLWYLERYTCTVLLLLASCWGKYKKTWCSPFPSCHFVSMGFRVRHTVWTHNLHPSVCTSHTYLTMFGVHDWHLLQLPTQANSLQHCHRVHLLHSDLPQTLQVWKGCSYNITSTLGQGKRTMLIICSASKKLMRYRREQTVRVNLVMTWHGLQMQTLLLSSCTELTNQPMTFWLQNCS